MGEAVRDVTARAPAAGGRRERGGRGEGARGHGAALHGVIAAQLDKIAALTADAAAEAAAARLAEATGHTAERYQAPEAAETARKRRMH